MGDGRRSRGLSAESGPDQDRCWTVSQQAQAQYTSSRSSVLSSVLHTRARDDKWSGDGAPVEDDERGARLDRLAAVGSKLTYTYDFGDNWEHRIVVEKVSTGDSTLTYTVCTGGRRACPPEDCGGVWGYANLLAVLADPSDEEHETMLEWVGGAFDPDAFDRSMVTERLRAMTPRRKPRV